MRRDIEGKRGLITEWVASNTCKSVICRNIGCQPDTLNRYLKIWGIYYKGNPSRKGQKRPEARYMPAAEYATKPWCSSHKLKLKLINEGLRGYHCENCLNTEWLGKPIPLELDHIDGNHFNNNFDNIRLLCPNCHATMETNSGRNKGRYGSVVQPVETAVLEAVC